MSGPPLTVTITAIAPPAGSMPQLQILRGPAPAWSVQNPPGFFNPPPPAVTFNGTTTSLTFQLQRDGTFLPVGQYGVGAQLGATQRVVGTFLAQ